MASFTVSSLPEDVEPVTGEEAKSYQEVIVEGVSKQFDGDEAKLQEFVKQTKDYGKGISTAIAFWSYLLTTFGKDKAIIFLPKLARLIPNEESRRALLKQPAAAPIDGVGSLEGDNAAETAVTEKLSEVDLADDGVSGGGGGVGGAAAADDDEDENPFDEGEDAFLATAAVTTPTKFGGGAAAEEDNPFTAEQRSGISFDEDENPFAQDGQDSGVGGSSSSSSSSSSSPSSAEALQVKEMFPDLPVPAIEAALENASLAAVIERALAGQIDVRAVPRTHQLVPPTAAAGEAAAPPPPAGGRPGRNGRHLSGRLIRVGDAQSKFPPECLPPSMLPRDLAKMQDLFPTIPTSLLQAELQVVGSVHTAMNVLLNDNVHVEVLELDPVPVALRGYLIKSDPQGRNFTRRFFILRQLTGSLCYAKVSCLLLMNPKTKEMRCKKHKRGKTRALSREFDVRNWIFLRAYVLSWPGGLEGRGRIACVSSCSLFFVL